MSALADRAERAAQRPPPAAAKAAPKRRRLVVMDSDSSDEESGRTQPPATANGHPRQNGSAKRESADGRAPAELCRWNHSSRAGDISQCNKFARG